MIDAKIISSLVDIAGRALAVDLCEQKRRKAQNDLRDAYHAWKTETGNWNPVARDTEEWRQLTTATAEEYLLLNEAKTAERNARKRLATAIRRYRTIEGVPANG